MIKDLRVKDCLQSFGALQQHLYNGLACPADYSIFGQEWMFAWEWIHLHGQLAGI